MNHKAKKRFSWHGFKKNYMGWLYMIPVILGLLFFTAVPMISSLVYSLHDYYPLRATNQLVNFGLQNYVKMFTTDFEGLSRVYFLTFRYALVTVPLSLVGSYVMALFVNKATKSAKVFSVVYYLPCLIPAVAGSLLWKDITKVNSGYINLLLEFFGFPPYSFYENVETVFPTIVLTGVIGWGGNMIMWLSQMKNVPTELYESAEIDGANYFHKLFHVTIPMTTSMTFYLLITGIISAMQVFGNFYALRNGICDSEINFIVLRIYDAAFNGSGGYSYACALSWGLFVVIGILTAFIFKTSKWVYYGEEM